MAKTSADILITDILHRMGRDTTGVKERADVLHQLNISQHEICDEQSLRFLMTPPTATLAVVASTCAVPATIDPSKTMTLGRPSGDGEITYVELDAWYTTAIDLYGQGSAQTEPTHYTVAGSNFYFKPPALNATVPYLAQLRVVDMTDANNSYSMLPEGYEHTLLAVDCEAELRRELNEPQAAELKARADRKREVLYGAERTTKLKAWVDREQKERKVEKAQLADEAAP
jgi:hypothetical protein